MPTNKRVEKPGRARSRRFIQIRDGLKALVDVFDGVSKGGMDQTRRMLMLAGIRALRDLAIEVDMLEEDVTFKPGTEDRNTERTGAGI